jgi:uncharacterized lipoprotein YmbA
MAGVARSCIRRPGGEIVASQTARWAERLSIGVTRTVALSLAGSLPQLVVTASPPLDAPKWQVLIDIDAFDAQVDGPCTKLGAEMGVTERNCQHYL